MHPKHVPTDEATFATDEFFKRQPVLPDESDFAENFPIPASPLSDNYLPLPDDEAARPSVLRDYVRELQQEFEDQEKEGKI
jgi:hypothetical protein